MAKVYYEKDVVTDRLRDKTIAVIGYGIQGRAQALNLRDSGVKVVLGLRRGESWNRAEKEDFVVSEIRDAVESSDIVMMLIPDEVQPDIYDKYVEPNLRPGKALVFAHGFNIRYGTIKPPHYVDVIMIAPKAPGAAVRETYVEGIGVPCLMAVHQDYTGQAQGTALSIAHALHATKVGVIETTFDEETETDLFGEQAVLCGGVTELIKRGFDVLIKAGYQPEVAYFEVLHEMKMIVDLIQKGGIEHMWDNVSNTAEYGGRTRGSAIINAETAERMKKLLDDIKSGDFAREWTKEYSDGCISLNQYRQTAKTSTIEKVGTNLRQMFREE